VKNLRAETEKEELVKKFEENRLFSLSNEKSLSESSVKTVDLIAQLPEAAEGIQDDLENFEGDASPRIYEYFQQFFEGRKRSLDQVDEGLSKDESADEDSDDMDMLSEIPLHDLSFARRSSRRITEGRSSSRSLEPVSFKRAMGACWRADPDRHSAGESTQSGTVTLGETPGQSSAGKQSKRVSTSAEPVAGSSSSSSRSPRSSGANGLPEQHGILSEISVSEVGPCRV